MKSPFLTAFLLLASTSTSAAFTSPVARSISLTNNNIQQRSTSGVAALFASDKKAKEEESVFVPPEAAEEESDEEDIPLDAVEKLGKGAAKVRENIALRF